jgi:hypothetical protein
MRSTTASILRGVRVPVEQVETISHAAGPLPTMKAAREPVRRVLSSELGKVEAVVGRKNCSGSGSKPRVR